MCVVEIRAKGRVTERRRLTYVGLGGERRAVTLAEKAAIMAERRLQQLVHEAQERYERLVAQVDHMIIIDDPAYVASGTVQCGGSNPEQRITRCAYGHGSEWFRKDKHHRACARDGKKQLRAKTRAKLRRTALH